MENSRNNYLRVPYGMTVHGNDEIDAVIKVLKTSTQMGASVNEFELEIARTFDKKFGVMVNSGSSALMLAMELLDLPEGSEVITPALTFATTVAYILRNNLIPVYVDVEEGTYIINLNKIEEMITDRTAAIVVPHLIGNVVDFSKIAQLANRYNIKIIEDSADTLGAQVDGKSAGTNSDMSITSFYGSHIINGAGNGGMLCLNNIQDYDKARLLRSWGRSSSLYSESESIENRFNVLLDGIEYDAKFVFEEIGHNLEPSEISAAFGLVQFKNLNNNIKSRINNFIAQYSYFKKFEEHFILPKQTANSETGWLAFPLTIRESSPFARKEMQIFLESRNIQTRVVFTGNITRQPAFKDQPMRVSSNGYPEADKVMKSGVLLACHHGLTSEMMAHVHQSFDDFIAQY